VVRTDMTMIPSPLIFGISMALWNHEPQSGNRLVVGGWRQNRIESQSQSQSSVSLKGLSRLFDLRDFVTTSNQTEFLVLHIYLVPSFAP